MNGTLSGRIEETWRRLDSRTAAYDGTGRAASYRELLAALLGFAAGLRKAGVTPRARVCVTFEDAITAPVACLAILRIGAVALPQPVAAVEAALGAPPDYTLLASGATPSRPSDIVIAPGWFLPPENPPPISGAGLIVHSTSGTTGIPQYRASTDARSLARIDHATRHRPIPPGPVYIGYRSRSSPGLNHTFRMLAAGQALVFQQATPAATLAEIGRREVETALLSPFAFNELVAAVEAGAPAPAMLRLLMMGGGALSPALAARGERLLGAEVVTTYGSCETGSIAHCRLTENADPPGIVGRPYPGNRIAFAADGEVRVAVPVEMRQMDFPSMIPLDGPEGWIDTGDIGERLPDGRLRLTGRKSELLNIGGTKRAPGVFEAVAAEHSAVREALAFRAPDPSGMDHLGLALVADPAFDMADFARHMLARLGGQTPMQVTLVDALPRNAGGKPDRRSLTEAFLAARPPD